MKLSWILVLCIAVSFCSADETLENDAVPAEVKSEVESSDVKAIARGWVNYNCMYGKECKSSCDCCEPEQRCSFTYSFSWSGICVTNNNKAPSCNKEKKPLPDYPDFV